MLCQVLGKKLQRYPAAKLEVFRDPHGSHPARAQAFKHLVVRNPPDRTTSRSFGLYRRARGIVNQAHAARGAPRGAKGCRQIGGNHCSGSRFKANSDTREAAGGSRFASTATT